MSKNRWISRLLAGTRGRILAQLRHAPATVSELSERLELSANAVRSQLAALERDGLIGLELRPPRGVGKPAHQYRITPDAAALSPKAYDTLLDVVLTAARERTGVRGYAKLLKTTAAKLAGPPRAERTSLAARVADTKALLATVGAAVEVERSAGKLRLRGSECPLSGLVAAHPELCGVLADVIARRLGVPVTECCDRTAPMPRCCFEAILADAA